MNLFLDQETIQSIGIFSSNKELCYARNAFPWVKENLIVATIEISVRVA